MIDDSDVVAAPGADAEPIRFLFQLPQEIGIRCACELPDGKAFEQHAQVVDVAHIPLGQFGNERTAPGNRNNESFVLEQPERFAQRRAAHPKGIGEFDFEQALSFSGRSAPYLQYAYARAGKLIEGGPDGPVPDEPGYELDQSELALARLLSMWPSTARRAAEKYEPAFVCTYLYELASAFSDFYRDCRVLGEPEPQRVFRTALVRAFRQVVRTGFRLLALPLPEAM